MLLQARGTQPTHAWGTQPATHIHPRTCAPTLIVAGALADAVDVAPVGLSLRVLKRVPIHLARAGQQEASLQGGIHGWQAHSDD